VLDDDAVTDAARRLLAAERSREPIRQLSLQYPDMTIEDAYRVQRALVALKLAEGRTIKARKIGLTVPVTGGHAAITVVLVDRAGNLGQLPVAAPRAGLSRRRWPTSAAAGRARGQTSSRSRPCAC
jgi:hypothetical protein